jgi:hypothetical protein
MKVLNRINNPRWKKFIKHDEQNIDCLHCRYEKALESVPTKDFEVEGHIISSITITYGRHDDVIGWSYGF